MKFIENIVPVKGFTGSGLHAGIKKKKQDLAVVYSEVPAVSAAVFTKNVVKAAPIMLSTLHLRNDSTRAFVVNSGNANACTGEVGANDARTMAKLVADNLGISPEEVLVASTGVIGQTLPMDKIEPGIQNACNTLNNNTWESVSECIMTTDTFPKRATVTFEIDGTPITITGFSKGSGMIHPNMGTMLGFLLTDANIDKSALQTALSTSVIDTYNMVSVDGDTSTNDMVMVLANGEAKNKKITENSSSYIAFYNALHLLNQHLAKLIAQDGEGATKLVQVDVHNATSMDDARLIAKAIITSSLVKTALFGNDANWGRILCAMGYSSGSFDPLTVDIVFASETDSIDIVKQGVALDYSEEHATDILKQQKVWININLHDGEHHATAWGCDLSYDYVKINGSYRS